MKQYEMLGDTCVIDRSVSTARAVSDGVVVVVPASDAEREVVLREGSRSESVRRLAQVPADADIVCVHDAARPCINRPFRTGHRCDSKRR